jgi:hypothetical protein
MRCPARDQGVVPVSDVGVRGDYDFLSGGGEMGARMRAFDWATTPLGSPEGWPQNLKNAIALCLGSPLPTVIWWNRDTLTQFYNDSFISLLGSTKHPGFLGRSGRECWGEAQQAMAPLWDKVFATGEAHSSENALHVVNRALAQEEIYVTASYTAIRGEADAVDGIFYSCYETTTTVLRARRLETLRRLAEQATGAGSVADASAAAAAAEAALAGNLHDVPFAGIYLLDANGRLPANTAAPDAVASVVHTRRPTLVSGLELPGGAWPEPTTQAIMLPLFPATRDAAIGVIALGVSPRRPPDEEYRTFFDLIAGQVSTAIVYARAREDASRRAEASPAEAALRESEARLRALIECCAIPGSTSSGAGRHTSPRRRPTARCTRGTISTVAGSRRRNGPALVPS